MTNPEYKFVYKNPEEAEVAEVAADAAETDIAEDDADVSPELDPEDGI
jgi:hypothetical protein